MSELAWLPCQCLDGIDLEDEEVFVNAACQDCQGTGLHFPQLTEPCKHKWEMDNVVVTTYPATYHRVCQCGRVEAKTGDGDWHECFESNGSGRILTVTVEKLLDTVLTIGFNSIDLYYHDEVWYVTLYGAEQTAIGEKGDTLLEALESVILAVVYASKS